MTRAPERWNAASMTERRGPPCLSIKKPRATQRNVFT